jgi:geranylgeranyl pyrophosphate synthase
MAAEGALMLKPPAQAHVREAVHRMAAQRAQANALVSALSRPGFPLHPSAPLRTAALATGAYRLAGGRDEDVASRAAAAMELIMAAGYMLDHVGDGEVPGGKSRQGEELALGLAALTIGVRLAAEAVALSPSQQPLALLSAVFDRLTAACAGQLLDSRTGSRSALTVDDAFAVTELKAGSLGVMAARFGATLAGGSPVVIDSAGAVGQGIFTYLQFIDDVRDAFQGDEAGSDYAMDKATIPLVFVYNRLKEHGRLDGLSATASTAVGRGDGVAGDVFVHGGGQAFGTLVAESVLLKTKQALDALRLQGYDTEVLDKLASSVKISITELGAAA